jgi:hypothetical protein
MSDNERDDLAVLTLARMIYIRYCDNRSFTPYEAPWVPKWAVEYARVAVSAYGYDDEALDEAISSLRPEVTA